MRLIDAEALEEDFYDNYDKKGYRNGKSLIYAAWCLLKKIIEKAPTIEAKPVVHAHWEWVKIEDGDSYFELAECSHCRGQSAREYPYCRYCGAQMDEKEGE